MRSWSAQMLMAAVFGVAVIHLGDGGINAHDLRLLPCPALPCPADAWACTQITPDLSI